MISERLQKSREFIESECVKAASAQNLCRELKHSEFGGCFPVEPRQIGNLPNSNPLYRGSANVWRKRRLARSLIAMRWLTANSDRIRDLRF